MKATATLAAFLRRDWATAVSYRLPFVLELIAILFTLTLFFYLGRLVDNSAAPPGEGLKNGYFAFVVVGLALLRIVQTGFTSFAQKLRQEQTTGTFEALMTTPTRPSLLILCSAAYDLLWATVSGLGLIAAAIVLFGLNLNVDGGSLLVAAIALIGCLALFAALGVALAAFTVVFKQTTALVGMVVTGLALLGGVYFPIEVLPAPLRLLADSLPFTWGLDVLRAALLTGNADIGRLLLLLASAAVSVPAALVLFKLALHRARMAGTLAHY